MTRFWDKFDRLLTKKRLMNPLTQFDRYLHRHNLEHTHPNPNTIIRKFHCPVCGHVIRAELESQEEHNKEAQ